jgi:N-acetylmuramoyl-L-alanine amidase
MVLAAATCCCLVLAAVWAWRSPVPARRTAASAHSLVPRRSPPAAVPVDPARFSPGACVALAPTRGDRHQTVFLDAGHGGPDPGAVGRTGGGAAVDEAAVNLPVELDAAALLRAQGYRVVVSRTRNTTVARLGPADVTSGALRTAAVLADVAARDVCANLARASVLIGIYMDSGNPGNAGCVTGYDPARPFSAQNLRLATLVQNDVLGAMNAQGYAIPDEGVLPDTGLGSASDSAAVSYRHLVLLGPAQAGYFASPSHMPGALIEPLFLSDPFEASIAASPSGQHLIARGLAQAVTEYLAAPSAPEPVVGKPVVPEPVVPEPVVPEPVVGVPAGIRRAATGLRASA